MQAWVIGNWKQQPATWQAVDELLNNIINQLPAGGWDNCQLMVIPSQVHLQAASRKLDDSPVVIGAQDICGFSADTGAFTGDCSAAQVRDAGASWALVGHSERRQYYGEDNELLQQKISHALSQQLGVIFCVGETKAQYDSGQTLQVLEGQLTVIKKLLADDALTVEQPLNERLIIAYEPVWAIGTGKVPTVEEVTATHAHIKQVVDDFPSATQSLGAPCVLYGGSVNPGNAAQFAQSNMIDGALVGGASLDANSFLAIADAFSIAKHQ